MKAEDSNLELRFMTVDDLPEIQVIERQCFPTPWSMQAFLSELTNNDCAHYMVMRKNERVVGYIGMWLILDEGHITNVAVEPGSRGQGIGTGLLTTMSAYAYIQGVRRMTLEVRVTNYRAQQLYRRLGFEGYGIRTRYYQDNNEDALIMWKDLEEDEFKSQIDAWDRD